MGALLDDIDDPAGFDLMQAVAKPLPVIVIAEMLGVPPEDRAQFNTWSAQRARLLEPTIGRREREAGGRGVTRAFDAYFQLDRRSAPGGAAGRHILSALVQAEDEGERLTERETLNMLRLLLIAGNETTTNLIGNGILALLRNPEQLQRLRDDPALIPSAVEELLRFDSPVQTDFRRVLEDCEVNGSPGAQARQRGRPDGRGQPGPGGVRRPGPPRCRARPRDPISPSAGVSTTASAPRWRGSRDGSCWRCCSSGSRRSELATYRPRFRRTIVLRGLEALPLRCA